ncbi:hypothetical protein [Celeribacter indicus]|uniref:hypothetical protein n=1 Tax=Celeribacter indicus TaxID=1208324 RepID=UPI000894B9E5|nr:hypothetical protein [Celeribacter indicus]SDW85170.1 hypothetical protein SAMN05443573_10860 [Celeribacter indicus]
MGRFASRVFAVALSVLMAVGVVTALAMGKAILQPLLIATGIGFLLVIAAVWAASEPEV